MLTMVVPFLSQGSGKSRGNGPDREGSEARGGEPAQTPGNKRKRDGTPDSVSADATDKVDKAGEKAKRAFKEEFGDYSKIGTPDKLFWHDKSKKKKKMIYPVRVVPREEVVGIALGDWNEDTHCPIHYIRYPRNTGAQGSYATASRRSLSPYYGEGEKDRWCPLKVEKYAKQLKKDRTGLDATDIQIEAAFLACALQKSLAEGEQAEQRKAVDDAMPEDIATDRQAATAPDSESDDDDEEEARGGRRTLRRSTGGQERKEPLRLGDHIEYYAQQSTGGDERGRRTAEILYIDPKGNRGQPLLTIDDPMTALQPDHHVKRVKRQRYGKLLDHDGVYRPIDEYVLKKEGDPEAHAKILARNTAVMKEGIQRRKEETLANMEKDGFNSSLAKDALRM